jgi:hypothetical protein
MADIDQYNHDAYALTIHCHILNYINKFTIGANPLKNFKFADGSAIIAYYQLIFYILLLPKR